MQAAHQDYDDLPWVGATASSSSAPRTRRSVAIVGNGTPRPVQTAFFLDCSASQGLPEGAAPDVYCADGKTCMSLDDECGRVRRAMLVKKQVPKLGWCLSGDTAYVRVTDGNLFEKCCITGKPGLEEAECQLMWPRPMPPPKPPPVPQPMPQSLPGLLRWAAQKAAKFAKDKLKAALGIGLCGGVKCEPIGDANPVCLMDAKGKSTCVYQGASGMLYPEKPPSKGLLRLGSRTQKYKVFQFSMPYAPVLPQDLPPDACDYSSSAAAARPAMLKFLGDANRELEDEAGARSRSMGSSDSRRASGDIPCPRRVAGPGDFL